MFVTKKGHSWTCDNQECMDNLDSMISRSNERSDFVHCMSPDCHGAKYCDHGAYCKWCEDYYCAYHTGKMNKDNTCGKCVDNKPSRSTTE